MLWIRKSKLFILVHGVLCWCCAYAAVASLLCVLAYDAWCCVRCGLPSGVTLKISNVVVHCTVVGRLVGCDRLHGGLMHGYAVVYGLFRHFGSATGVILRLVIVLTKFLGLETV